jgi:hypothetical protein
MFQKGLIIVISLCGILFAFSFPALAASAIPINDLVEESLEYDGQTVSVQGEAIGEVLERGEYAWVNINDGGNAIGIWMSLEDARKIEFFGDYRNSGDILLVTGVFSRNCVGHGGEVDIHCDKLEIISAGHHVVETVAPAKILIALVLFTFAALAVIIAFVLRRGRTAA